MTHFEFLEIFKPIVARHPDTFTADVCEKVYKMFMTLNVAQGRNVVATVMLHSRMTPTEENFREAIRVVLAKSLNSRPAISSDQSLPSMFTHGQRMFLFAITKKVARREIKNQNKYVDLVLVPTLEKIIEAKDQDKVHHFFEEVSREPDIPYDPEFPEGA